MECRYLESRRKSGLDVWMAPLIGIVASTIITMNADLHVFDSSIKPIVTHYKLPSLFFFFPLFFFLFFKVEAESTRYSSFIML